MKNSVAKVFDKTLLIILALTISLAFILPDATSFAKEDNDDQKEANVPSNKGMEYAGGKTLSGDHSYSDLYASFIFSRSNGDTASQDKTSTETLLQYPTDPDDSENAKADSMPYGQMSTPFHDTPKKKIGKQTATYINTLYDYEYLVPASNSEKDNAFGAFKAIYNAATGKGNKGNNFLTAKALDTSSVGATMFDFFTGAINQFSKIVRSLDFSRLITGKVGKNDGFLMQWFEGIFLALGLTPGNIKLLKSVVTIILIGVLTMTLIVAMGSRNVKLKSGSATKRWGLRIFVSIMTIAVSVMATQLTDKISDLSEGKTKHSAAEFNESYVVDTLLVAATNNLNIGQINPSKDIAANDNGGKDTNFKPTPKGINRLMKDANQRAKHAGLGNQESSAKALISNIADQKPASTDDYFTMLEEGGTYNGTAVTASGTTPLFSSVSQGYEAGPAFAKDENAKINNQYTDGDLPRNPIFMTTNKDAQDTFKSVMEDYKDKDDAKSKDKQAYYIPKGKKVKDDKKGRTIRQEASEKLGYSLSYKQISHNSIPQATNSTYRLSNVKPSDPSTYIYGAIPPGKITQENKEYTNYINGPKSIQRNDPVTGKSKVDDKKLKNSMNINGLRIGLMNRFGGISQPQDVQMKSLSTQSTTFLLQTEHPKKGSLIYKGFNAVSSEAGEAKQTGKNGAGFLRYTIPNSGKTDLLTKIGSINITWTVAGIVAMMSFFYLLIAPVFGSIYKQLTGFCSGFFMGNFAGLGKYLIYKIALTLSFVAANVAVFSGVSLASGIVGKFDLLGKIFASKNFVPTSVASGSTIIIGLLIGIALMWPVAKFNLGLKGKQRTLSVLGVFIAFAYIIADVLAEKLDELYIRVYGDSATHGMIQNVKGRTRRIKQGQMLKNATGKFAKTGGAAGLAAVTGGTSAIGSMAASGGRAVLASKATQKLGGAIGNMGAQVQGLGAAYGLRRDGKSSGLNAIGQSMSSLGASIQGKSQQAADVREGERLLKGRGNSPYDNNRPDYQARNAVGHDNMMKDTQGGQQIDPKTGQLVQTDRNGNKVNDNGISDNRNRLDDKEISRDIGRDGKRHGAEQNLPERFDKDGNRIKPEYDNNGKLIDDGKQHYDKDGKPMTKDDIQTKPQATRMERNEDSKENVDDKEQLGTNTTAIPTGVTNGFNRDGGQNVDQQFGQPQQDQPQNQSQDQSQGQQNVKSDNANIQSDQASNDTKGNSVSQDPNNPQEVSLKDGQTVRSEGKDNDQFEGNALPKDVNVANIPNASMDNNDKPQDVNVNDMNTNNNNQSNEPQDVRVQQQEGKPQEVNVNDMNKGGQPQDVRVQQDRQQPQQVQVTGSNGQPQSVQIDSSNLQGLMSESKISPDVAKQLQDIGKVDISPQSAEMIAKSPQFAKAMDFKQNATQQIELDQKRLEPLKQKIEYEAIQSKAQGIQPQDNPNYQQLQSQISNLEKSIQSEGQKITAAESRMQNAVRSANNSTRVDRTIEKTKEIHNNYKETKFHEHTSNVAKGIGDIVKGNDSPDGGSTKGNPSSLKNNNLNNNGNSSNLSDNSRQDRRSREILNELRRLRQDNNRNK